MDNSEKNNKNALTTREIMENKYFLIGSGPLDFSVNPKGEPVAPLWNGKWSEKDGQLIYEERNYRATYKNPIDEGCSVPNYKT